MQNGHHTTTTDSTAAESSTRSLSLLQKRLLDEFQRGFPLVARPYQEIGAILGVSEETVLEELSILAQAGYISRVGGVMRPNQVGVSTLAAMAVPPERLEEVAQRVSAYAEVNHNYEREHHYNLWFVAGASDESRLDDVLSQIQSHSGLPVLRLPLVEDYHIDLGFRLQWK